MAKFIKQDAGILKEEATLQVSAGSGSSGKLVHLDGAGKLDATLIPAVIGAETVDLVATEALAAGDIVNIWNDAGTAKVRKASASNESTKASGFVLSAHIALALATVYLEGTNNALSGLTPGTTYFLGETSGSIVSTAVTTPGAIVQQVGRSHSANKLSFEASQPIVLA